MQTFLPFQSFRESALVLDSKRLGKQRVECLQILQIIGRKQGWLPNPDNKRGFWNHPAVRMWEENVEALIKYSIEICIEWKRRGNEDTVRSKITFIGVEFSKRYGFNGEILYPTWLTPEFCLSHQSNLIRKDPIFYGPKFPNVPNNLPYIWPV